MNIKNYILSYNFDGKIEHIYKKYGSNDIIKTVLEISKNTSSDETLNIELFNAAITIITDAIVSSDLSDMDKKLFQETLVSLNYFEKIEKYLYNEYLKIKCIVIHSMGKISITDNLKYLEKAFEKYFNKNPIICSKLLCEIKWLDDKKYNHYCSLTKKDMDLINSMTLSIDNSDDYLYEIMVYNIQNNLKQKDWTREEYIKSIFLIDFNIKTNFPCLLNYFNSIFNKIIKLTQNKTLEIQLTFSNNLITGINIYKNIHSDHTPFSFEMSILGLTLIIIIYDHRHWDYENNKYEEYKNN